MGKWSQVLVAAAVIGGLSGCNKASDDAAAGADKQIVQQSDPCNATKVDEFLGMKPEADVKSKITTSAGSREVRYIAPGDPPADGRKSSRLNADIGPDGTIAMFWCG